jgi:enoyl-CoA hydratase/carnithine racemase
LNAIGATMLRELAEAARWFDRQQEVVAVILSGAGRAFSAGADLMAEVAVPRELFGRILDRIARLRPPDPAPC